MGNTRWKDPFLLSSSIDSIRILKSSGVSTSMIVLIACCNGKKVCNTGVVLSTIGDHNSIYSRLSEVLVNFGPHLTYMNADIL